MALFDRLGRQPQGQAQNVQRPMTDDEMRREVDSIKSNPVSYLRERGYNIPDDMTDVNQITQYMLRNGMIGQNRLMQVMRRIGIPGMR